MMRFREVRETKPKRNVELGFDPDKLIVPGTMADVDEIVREAQRMADDTWIRVMADKLIE